MKIGFFGLSHLSLNSAVVAAMKGFHVNILYTGKRLENIEELVLKDIFEPGLKVNLSKFKKKIKFSNELRNFKECKLVFFAEDTKTLENGKTDIRILKRRINSCLKRLSKNTIFINMAQVPPGLTENIKWPNNKKYYQVETLIFGNAIQRALKPERIIIGCKLKNQKKFLLNKLYLKYLNSFKCPIIVGNFNTAELTKISINLFLISDITLTNVLSDITKKYNADWDKISSALKQDKRIGKHSYLKPNFNFGGTNLIRDLQVFKNISKKNNLLSLNYFKDLENLNNARRKILPNLIKRFTNDSSKKKLTVLGLSYKENTNSTMNSQALEIIKNFKKIKIFAFDPVVKAMKLKQQNITISNTIEKALTNTDVLVIATPWEEFKRLKTKLIEKYLKNKVIIDPYKVLQGKKISSSIHYLTL